MLPVWVQVVVWKQVPAPVSGSTVQARPTQHSPSSPQVSASTAQVGARWLRAAEILADTPGSEGRARVIAELGEGLFPSVSPDPR